MLNYLSNYIVTRQELTKVSEDIKGCIETQLSGEDRLHSFLQLYEIAKTVLESLQAVDKAGFLSQIQSELDEVQQKMDTQLSEKASMYRNQLEDIQKLATTAETELHKRSECIESVLDGMGKIAGYQTQIDEIRQMMAELETSIAEISRLRQSAPFEEMCKLIVNET